MVQSCTSVYSLFFYQKGFALVRGYVTKKYFKVAYIIEKSLRTTVLSDCLCFYYIVSLIPRLTPLSLSFTFLDVLTAGLAASPCLPPADPHLWMLGVAARPGLLDCCFQRALCMIVSGHQADELLSSIGLVAWNS